MSALKYLAALGLLLTAVGFVAEPLGEYVGPVEYQGYLGFGYPEGENPINNIVFTVDSAIASNLIILDVPSPWSHSYSGGALTLSGGSLSPGGNVLVKVSLNKYFEDGDYVVNSVGTTTAGESSQASGPLQVGELNLLNIIGLAADNKYMSTGVAVSFGFIELMLMGRKKDEKTTTVNGDGSKTVSDDLDIKIPNRVLRKDVHIVKIDDLDPELLKKVTEEDKSSNIGSVVPELAPNVDTDFLKKKAEEERKRKLEEERKKNLHVVTYPFSDEDIKRIDETLSKKGEKVAETPDEIAKKIGDSFMDGVDKSTDSTKTDTDLPPKDNNDYDDSDLPGLNDPEVTGETKTDPPTVEYDDSDLPGLDTPLTDETLKKEASELEKKGSILDSVEKPDLKIDQGVGITSDGDLITLSDDAGKSFDGVRPPDTPKTPAPTKDGASFSEEAGLELEKQDIEYRDGDTDTHSRKITGLQKNSNIVMKRSDFDSTSAQPEEKGFIRKIVDYFKSFF